MHFGWASDAPPNRAETILRRGTTPAGGSATTSDRGGGLLRFPGDLPKAQDVYAGDRIGVAEAIAGPLRIADRLRAGRINEGVKAASQLGEEGGQSSSGEPSGRDSAHRCMCERVGRKSASDSASIGRDIVAVREIGRDAVKAAIREFRRRGPEAMLAKYGGGLSTHWYIQIGRSHFDQKLVIRAAHQHQGLGRLGDFNAGQAKGRLERLGYRVVSKRSERDGPVLVCRVAWMPGYQSNEEEARGGGSYVDEGNVPHESLNFRPVRQTYYGFVENGGKGLGIERLGAGRTDETIDGVSVLFCATDRETSEFLLTGWYTNATVHRHPIKRPGRDRLQREVYFTATDATVIPESERCFHLPRKRDKHKCPFGGIGPRTFVWYGLNDDRAAGFRESLHRYMTTRVSTQTPDEVVVESRKRRISERLERQGASRQFIKEKGYRCEACGWSLDEFDEEKQSVWKSSFELHHLTPFSKLEEGGSRTVRSDDFAVLCASCHRAIHRTDHVSDVQAFVQACQPKDRSPRP